MLCSLLLSNELAHLSLYVSNRTPVLPLQFRLAACLHDEVGDPLINLLIHTP